MKTCTSCRKFESCPKICDEMLSQIENQPPRKALTNEEKISYAIFVLSTAGINPMQILEVSRYVSKIQKSKLYEDLPRHLEEGRTMVDYFLTGFSRFSMNIEPI